ncbi:sentrin-specific protease 8-like [Drosophila albomicans]|uniref:Sentrin-specific protease 8-like n=1 Tax=Drosophila albomicans TaxID=7291 RepID=A0A6P8XYW3_DROAB|nr:sentrin-specific protease 8-like [Drosophila albomicans]XP_051861256.1 sentrin-specific protease 8-like [Drosophila albomicans]
MPRNVRQKKRAERRMQQAKNATIAPVGVPVAVSVGKERSLPASECNGKKKPGHSQMDKQAMGDGGMKCSDNDNDNKNENEKDENNIKSSSNEKNNNISDDDGDNYIEGSDKNACSSNSNSSLNVNANMRKPRASRADPILAALSRNSLRMSDVQLLHGPHWINEAIVNFYFAYMEEIKYKANDDFLFLTPEMSQCMLYMDDKELHSLLVAQYKATRKSFIFMALNGVRTRDRNTAHFTLLVASRPDKAFYHFDSYGGNNSSESLELSNNIKDVLEMQHARFRCQRCLQQTNDYDCGIHVICMVDQLTDYVNRYDSLDGVQPLPQDVVKAKRNQLIKLVASLGKLIA